MSDLLYSVEGAIARITVNRPEQRNAFTFEMYDRLRDLCAEIEADPRVRAVILVGAGGKAFASGTDIRELTELRTREQVLAYEERMSRNVGALANLARPVIAQIEGYCIGGGLALATACDLRYSTPDAQFAAPPATLGNVFAPPITARLVALLGPARTKDLLYTARRVGAEEAERMGLVNGVWPRDEIGARVQELAERIAQNAPLSIRAAKAMLARMSAQMLAGWSADDLVVDAYTSADFQEGVRAFLEKRRPEWQGR